MGHYVVLCDADVELWDMVVELQDMDGNYA